MQDMPQGKPAAPAAGGASNLVADIHSKMMELMELMDGSQAVTDEDKQALGGIIAQYRGFVEQNLGAAPGQKKPQPQQPEQAGPVPMEAGARAVSPSL